MTQQETKQVYDIDKIVIDKLNLLEQRMIGNEVWIARAKNMLERQSVLLQKQQEIIDRLRSSVNG